MLVDASFLLLFHAASLTRQKDDKGESPDAGEAMGRKGLLFRGGSIRLFLPHDPPLLSFSIPGLAWMFSCSPTPLTVTACDIGDRHSAVDSPRRRVAEAILPSHLSGLRLAAPAA